MPEQQITKIAVFIDFENIAVSAANHFGEFDLGLLLKAIQGRGRVTLKRAYGDWSRLVKYRDQLRENAVELVQLYSYNPQQGGKNRADIRLVIDVVESLYTLDYIDTIVIVSGDSDFSSLMSKSREFGKYTIGVGVQASTSDLLIKACDEFIFYDKLVEAAYEQLKARRDDAPSESGMELPVATEASNTTREQTDTPLSEEKAWSSRPPAVKLAPPPVTITYNPQPAAAAPVPLSEREVLRYFFEDLRLPVVAADVRANTLTELLAAVTELIVAGEPGGVTLNQAINKLKARYDFENIYRKREDIRAVAKLAYRAGLLDFGAECASLSAYVRGVSENDLEHATRLIDLKLLRIALEANLTLTVPGAALVLFAPARGEGYCVDLLDDLVEEHFAEVTAGRYTICETDAVNKVLQKPELREIKEDLARYALNPGERITRDEADRLFDRANELRRHDFVASAGYSLRGLKLLEQLYQQREPELGPDEFMWGAASYCSARAGVFFRNRDYVTARQYYLAFFWIAQEGDFAWELLKPLLPSLLSYFWMTLSHELEVRVPNFSGHTAPAEAVVALVKELNDVRLKKMEDLAFELATHNAALLRLLLAQIEAATPSTAQQRALEMLNAAHDRFTMGQDVVTRS
jgi:uncharacterized LabA/DUF88 family protein